MRGRLLALGLAGLLLAGCASAPLKSFDLSAAHDGGRHALRSALVIREPTASPDLDTDRILVRDVDGSLAVLSGAQWSQRLPLLVQTRLAQSFENAGLGGRVSRDAAAGGAQALEIDIRAFELDVATHAVKIDLAVKLVASASGRVRATQIFISQSPVAANDGPTVARALDATLRTLQAQIIVFAGR